MLVESGDVELHIRRNPGYRGPTVSYTWIFECAEGDAPNPSGVEGLTILLLLFTEYITSLFILFLFQKGF